MCFGGGNKSPPPVKSAPAPAPPDPAPDETQVGAARRDENVNTYGTTKGPSTRVDRSASSGVVGGSGLNL